MIDKEDRTPLRASTAPHGGAFGRRQSAGGSAGSGRRPAALPGLQARSRPPQPLIARYTWRVSLVGLSLVSLSAKMAHVLMWAPATVASQGGGGSATMIGEPPGLLTAVLLAAVIGLAWIAQGLTRAQALRIDADGVTGFTLLGTRHFDWADIELVKVDWHAIYKQQMTIHARVGSPTGGFGLVSPTMIPVMTGKIDTKLSEILLAIKRHRPDMPIQRSPMLDRLARFFTWYSKEWTVPH